MRIFSDSFDRANAQGLGTSWGNQWNYTDYPYEGNTTPDPMSAALNPRVENQRCIWGSTRGLGGGEVDFQGAAWSSSWPWPLAWCTQGQFDQFAQFDVLQVPWGCEALLFTVFCGASGNTTPDVYLQNCSVNPCVGQYGMYGLHIAGGPLGDIPGVVIVKNLFGDAPSFTPTGLRGHAGINFFVIGAGVSIVPFPSTYRLETRRVGNQWEMTAFNNGVQIAQATDGQLLQGMPAMGCDTRVELNLTNPGLNPQYIAQVTNFVGGML